jgi:site-specific DNA-methyltransferase (adenine-specific)
MPKPVQIGAATVLAGDCRTIMPTLGLVDAIVTDPPYGLEFMGKDWDKLTTYAGGNPRMKRHNHEMPQRSQFKEGVASNYGAPQKMPRCRKCGKLRMGNGSCKCPTPDFSYRHDESGFQIQSWHEAWARVAYDAIRPGGYLLAFSSARTHHRTWCAIEDAGFVIQDTIMYMFGTGFPKGRTQLKPAYEPICVAYKPGGARTLQIDECRIPASVSDIERGAVPQPAFNSATGKIYNMKTGNGRNGETHDMSGGRWPANCVHDGSDEVMEAFAAFGEHKAGGPLSGNEPSSKHARIWQSGMRRTPFTSHGDTGSAARFFYAAKASKADRAGSKHPTVKPVALMRYLVRLVCPLDGLVLDPFAGSGTTGAAAIAEGRRVILIEREPEYLTDIKRRLRALQRQTAKAA